MLDQVCQPLGLLDDQFQAQPRSLRQAGLCQHGRCQRKHAGDRLSHVMTCLPQALHEPGRCPDVNTRRHHNTPARLEPGHSRITEAQPSRSLSGEVLTT
jgi:hypothetical protein